MLKILLKILLLNFFLFVHSFKELEFFFFFVILGQITYLSNPDSLVKPPVLLLLVSLPQNPNNKKEEERKKKNSHFKKVQKLYF